MSNSQQLVISIEIASDLLLSKLSDSDIASFKSDPQSFVFANTNQDLGDMAISVVENTDNEIHLSLPYYENIEVMKADAIKDEDLDDVAGGEIIMLIAAVAGGIFALGCGGAVWAAAGTAAAAGVAVGIAVGVQDSQGKNLDGSKKKEGGGK